MKKILFGILGLMCGGIGLLLVGCSSPAEPEPQALEIAFLADIHFHDIYAEFADGSFPGVAVDSRGQQATIRTMESQLQSTRLFNENYFALLAALDDIAKRGITMVALPGDFSDDGQPIHIRGLRRILEKYQRDYGIKFFATPGNHDPVRPFDSPGGKPDYLGRDGHRQRIFSRGMEECRDYSGAWQSIATDQPLPTLCSEEVRHLGYQGIMQEMADFGFYPAAGDLYWETPYSSYRHQPLSSWNFSASAYEAQSQSRHYEICREGTGGIYRQSHYTDCSQVPDASYLVEPVAGLWLLVIDANVYLPDGDHVYQGSGNAGYNLMLSHKTHVVTWIAEVAERARENNKQLIAVSHYPMTDFYSGQGDAIAAVFGRQAFQLPRQPKATVSQQLADTGLQVHLGGHMHFNDTGVITGTRGNVLFNIQVPSLAAYVPAYKIMTLKAQRSVAIETVVLDKVPRFAELFSLYRTEYEALKHRGENVWDRNILGAKNYREFTAWHIRELTRHRFIPREWSADMQTLIRSVDGRELLILSRLQPAPDLQVFEDDQWSILKASEEWQQTEKNLQFSLQQAGLSLDDFVQWTLFDMVVDFYKIRNAGDLALDDIESGRLSAYRFLAAGVNRAGASTGWREEFFAWLDIFNALARGLPDRNFIIDLQQQRITEYSDN